MHGQPHIRFYPSVGQWSIGYWFWLHSCRFAASPQVPLLRNPSLRFGFLLCLVSTSSSSSFRCVCYFRLGHLLTAMCTTCPYRFNTTYWLLWALCVHTVSTYCFTLSLKLFALPAFNLSWLHVLLLLVWRYFASHFQKSISVLNCFPLHLVIQYPYFPSVT